MKQAGAERRNLVPKKIGSGENLGPEKYLGLEKNLGPEKKLGLEKKWYGKKWYGKKCGSRKNVGPETEI